MNLVGVLRGGIIRRTSPVSGLSAALVPAIVLLLGATFAQAADRDPFRVAPVVALEAESFALQEVRLLPGPFQHAQQKDLEYLLRLEPDRLLAGFRKEAGLTPKGEVYGGWESQGVAGHSLGHYLSACCLMYQATADARLRERIDHIVAELAACQNANGNGYVGAIPRGKEIFAEVARGDIRSQGFDLNGGWVPWYTQHKVLAGLRDAWVLLGNTTARDVLVRFADWVIATTKDLSEAQWQKMLACEHGGMNEVLADVYAITGDRRHLEVARKFHHRAVLDPLARQEDRLAGLHANTQIPKLIGAARLYELTGDQPYAVMSRFFWETVTRNHSYVTGGNSDGEHFGPPGRLRDRLSNNTTETCNTYNMIKLSGALFRRSTDAALADYTERALWNHILASQNPEDGMVCYFVPLRSGSHKTFLTPFDSFACCTGTGMENHARYGESIYFHSDDTLHVNQFIPSTVSWRAQEFFLRQETEFPRSDRVRLLIGVNRPLRLAVAIRHPRWANAPMRVRVNGKRWGISAKPGEAFRVERLWHDGDEIELRLPLAFRTEAMPDDPQRQAILWGPIVLAGDLGPEDREPIIPVLVTEGRPVDKWVRRVKGDRLQFVTRGVGRPSDVTLRPFYEVHDQRHAVYWDLFTKQSWAEREAELRADQERLRQLEARTVDRLAIGEMQPERDHQLEGENTTSGENLGRKWRHATDGGWFGFRLQCEAGVAHELLVTYWGSDAGNRQFDIVVNGRKLATQVLERNVPGQFFDVAYAIPAELTQGREHVTVRFQAQPDKLAGGVYGVRLLRAGAAAPR